MYSILSFFQKFICQSVCVDCVNKYIETLNYIKNNFSFNPKIFTNDLNKASRKAIKTIS